MTLFILRILVLSKAKVKDWFIKLRFGYLPIKFIAKQALRNSLLVFVNNTLTFYGSYNYANVIELTDYH